MYPVFKQSVLALCLLVPAAGLRGNVLNGPAENPFARPAPPAASPQPVDHGERAHLAGAMTLGGRTFVCIMDPVTKRARWLAVGTERDGIVALDYDAAARAVLLQSNGSARWVPLRTPTIAALTLHTTPGGGIDWEHFRLSEDQKARKAEVMVTDLLEQGYRARNRPRAAVIARNGIQQ